MNVDIVTQGFDSPVAGWKSLIGNVKRELVPLLRRTHAFRRWQGEKILRQRFRDFQCRELDLRRLQTFTEKLFNRMIMTQRHGNVVFSRMADKYRVRPYIADRIGEEHMVKLLWQGFEPEWLPFSELPAKCVIKTNHGSGQIIIYERGKTDRAEVIAKLKGWLAENWHSQEYHYYPITPCVLVEEFLEGNGREPPLDYRFWCFHGEPRLIQVDNHAHSINPFYSPAWKPLPVSYRETFEAADIPQPPRLDEMLKIAARLSEGFDFVRVDLYNIGERVLFSGMTFMPMAGCFRFNSPEKDAELGRLW